MSATRRLYKEMTNSVSNRPDEGYQFTHIESGPDFIELCINLWKRAGIVALVTVSVFALGLLYVAVLPSIYEAQAHVRPPQLSNLARLNQSQLISVTPDSIFTALVGETRSLKTQRQVFEEFIQETGYYDSNQNIETVFLSEFVPMINVLLESTDNEQDTISTMIVSVQHQNALHSAAIANALVAEAHEQVRINLLENLYKAIDSKIEVVRSKYQQQIESVKQSAKDKADQLLEADGILRKQIEDQIEALKHSGRMLHSDEIVRLREALSIAAQLNLEEPAGIYSNDTETLTENFDRSNYPMFLRGTKMLKAELEVLEKRDLDKHTSPELRQLEERLRLLERNREVEALLDRENHHAFSPELTSLKSELEELEMYRDRSYENLSLLRIDQEAQPAIDPVSPKTILILTLSAFIGFTLGTLVALFLGALQLRQGTRKLGVEA